MGEQYWIEVRVEFGSPEAAEACLDSEDLQGQSYDGEPELERFGAKLIGTIPVNWGVGDLLEYFQGLGAFGILDEWNEHPFHIPSRIVFNQGAVRVLQGELVYSGEAEAQALLLGSSL